MREDLQKYREIILEISKTKKMTKGTIASWRNAIYDYAMEKLFGEIVTSGGLVDIFKELEIDGVIQKENEMRSVQFFKVTEGEK